MKVCVKKYKKGENEIKNPIHTSISEEAIASGVCQALYHEDQFFGLCREAWYIFNRTCKTGGFFAGLYGKI